MSSATMTTSYYKMTLYEYSQLGCVVMTLSCGITLMLIGNTKVKSSFWLSWAKWAISLALIVVGLFNLAEYALDLKAANQLISRSINASTLYTVTFILAIAFIPIVQEMPMINMRPLQTAIITLVCSVLIWVSPWCAPSLSTILSVSSLALYLIELMQVLQNVVTETEQCHVMDETVGDNITFDFSLVFGLSFADNGQVVLAPILLGEIPE